MKITTTFDNEWKDYLVAANKWIEQEDYSELVLFRKKIRDRAKQIDNEVLGRFSSEWALPFNPLYLKLGGVDLSKTDPNLFNRMKTILRQQGEGKTCWACGLEHKKGETAFAAHEHWKWDDVHHVRQLASIRFLCIECHYLSHHAYWLFSALPDSRALKRLELFCRVNKCTVTEAYAHTKYSYRLCNLRQKYQWRLDLSPVSELIKEAENKQKKKA